jgi:Transmembrane domain of unknown function (DUF3566)
VTTGSGDSVLGGSPRFGDAMSPATRGSTVEPSTSRAKGIASSGSSTIVPDGARPVTVGTAPLTRKKGRRARLTVKRIDPWSTLKFSFVYGLAGLVVLLVCVIVLYGVIDAMGVISSLRSFLTEVSDSSTSSTSGTSTGAGLAAWLGFGRVMLIALVLGIVNVVLFTAFATLTAFIYNVCTDIVGGVEVTLAERN